jgi:hypothetical protein
MADAIEADANDGLAAKTATGWTWPHNLFLRN